ncbi:redox-active disulfide protein 2 [Pedobacter changchengzhani]|uniref:Redox-active disulfide protein 2 n=1 Tax=Pedobacter changchengzhani TaxID=2529274 RepID=A0A4V2ZZX6_9SPHI|nr:redox-active disulfide protein 2 [Pedobacter changchengzhani]TDG35203.1 redox-active disulfide protein 2 [Pedobacter changchengzhani]
MQSNKFKEMSNEDLVKAKKSLRSITYALGIMLVVLIILNIFLLFKKGFSPMIFVPVALLPIVIINISSIKKMKAELKLRGI